MNYKLRFYNKTTLISIITLVVSIIYIVLSWCGVVPKISQNEIMNVLLMIIDILVLLGVVVDPTTQGIKDAPEVMQYLKPRTFDDVTKNIENKME